MGYLVEFKKWKRIVEQNDGELIPIDFAVFVGTDKTPISDVRLNQEHGYKLVKQGKDTASIYEMTLSQAIYGKFSDAKIVGKTVGGRRDSISFGKTDLQMDGTIEILWSNANKSSKLRVSGNGALAIARIARAVRGQGITKEDSGSIVIKMGEEVSKEGRYAKFFSIIRSGADTRTLTAKINQLCRLGVKAICNDEAKKELDADLTSNWSEQNYANTAPFGLKTQNGSKYQFHFPNRKANSALSGYYGKYGVSDLIIRGRQSNTLNSAAKVLKTSYIDPGLDALNTYLPTFFQKEFAELPEKTVSRLIKKIQINISNMKKAYQVNRINRSMLRAFKDSTTIKKVNYNTEIQKDSLQFAPGKS